MKIARVGRIAALQDGLIRRRAEPDGHEHWGNRLRHARIPLQPRSHRHR